MKRLGFASTLLLLVAAVFFFTPTAGLAQLAAIDNSVLIPVTQAPIGVYGPDGVVSAIQGGDHSWARPSAWDADWGGSVLVKKQAAANNCSTGFARYDAFRKVWTPGAAAPTAREGYGVARGDDGLLYYFGGDNCTGTILNTVEAFNENTNTWSTGYPADPTSRTNVTAVAAENGLIYVIGGNDVNGNVLNVVESYNPHTKVWTTEASLPTARERASSVLGPNDKLYVAGGEDQNHVDLPVVEAFNPGAGLWETEAPMPEGRSNFGFAESPDGLLNIVGGTSNGVALSSVDDYSTTLNQWTPRFTLDAPRMGSGIVENDEGNLEILGGAVASQPSANQNEELDFTAPPNAMEHEITYYLHGSEVAPDEDGLTMDEDAPEDSGQLLSLNLLGGTSWYSHLTLNGTFGGDAAFYVSIPCGGLSLSLLPTVTLTATQPDGSSPQQLGSTTSLLGACSAGQQLTVQVPVTAPFNMNNQLIEVTISSVLGGTVVVPSGQAITMQAIGFTGPEY